MNTNGSEYRSHFEQKSALVLVVSCDQKCTIQDKCLFSMFRQGHPISRIPEESQSEFLLHRNEGTHREVLEPEFLF